MFNSYFKNEYLTTGNLRGNYVFTNCPKEEIANLINGFKEENNSVLPCNIKITREMEQKLEEIFTKCVDDNQKSIIARDFLLSSFMYKILTLKRAKKLKTYYVFETLLPGICAYDNADFEACRNFVLNAPNPIDVTRELVHTGRIELNIFLEDTQNKYIAQAVNNFVSARNFFGLRVITTNDGLSHNYDQCGNFVQQIHDYTLIDLEKFLEDEKI